MPTLLGEPAYHLQADVRELATGVILNEIYTLNNVTSNSPFASAQARHMLYPMLYVKSGASGHSSQCFESKMSASLHTAGSGLPAKALRKTVYPTETMLPRNVHRSVV